MAEANGAWGIDIGQAGLKAIRLKYAEAAGQVLAVAFDYVPHPKILSQPDAIPDELIAQALERFLSRNDVKGDRVCISVPGQTALTRFIQLPPVESSKVAEIVKYEARQQIPFALEDVCWQWQTLGSGTVESGYMLEAEVGLFAMKRDQVMQHLKPFTNHQVEVDLVQIAPLALYNFLAYDRLGVRPGEDIPAKEDHTIVLDMGADNTTLMVSNGQKIWIRNVPIGGNHFTRALTKEMKLTFAKAEHLKINATKAPDPRSVFQALRPVFNDYVSEIQRSIGYFSSVNRNAKIGRILGLGNGFKLAGLQKFLQQNLQYEIERVDSFQAIVGDSVLNASLFDENRLSFAVPYGLALQGLGLTRIHVDLLPEEIRTQRLIRQKKPWAVLTAASILFAMALSATGYARMAKSVGDDRWKPAKDVAIDVAKKAGADKSAYTAQAGEFEAQGKKDAQLVRSEQGRVAWLELRKAWTECLPRDKPDAFKPDEIARRNRIKVWKWTATKYPDLAKWYEQVKTARPGDVAFLRPEDQANPPTGEGYVVTLECVHYHEELDNKNQLIADKYGESWLRNTFIANLRKWRVSQQFPRPTGDVPVREIGITHPLVVTGTRSNRFDYFLDPRKAAGSRIVGHAGQGMRRFGAPVSGLNPPIPMGPGALGHTSSFGPGRGVRRPFGPPKKAAGKGKQTTEEEKNKLSIPITKCTVQFVWKPVPLDKRRAYNLLYTFFQENPIGDFAKAQEYVAKERKRIDEQNKKVSSFAKRHSLPPELTQAVFDDFVKLHYSERTTLTYLSDFFREKPGDGYDAARKFVDEKRKPADEKAIPPPRLTRDLFDRYVKKYGTKEAK
jgi:type IV pilus assembly protein PilM